MPTLPLLNEGEFRLIVRYSIESDEGMSEAVVNAFLAAGVDAFDRSTQLVDWVNADALENLSWSSDRPLYLCTRVWDHRVVMTPEEVRIYLPPDVPESRGL